VELVVVLLVEIVHVVHKAELKVVVMPLVKVVMEHAMVVELEAAAAGMVAMVLTVMMAAAAVVPDISVV
jgi:hypothetical protein